MIGNIIKPPLSAKLTYITYILAVTGKQSRSIKVLKLNGKTTVSNVISPITINIIQKKAIQFVHKQDKPGNRTATIQGAQNAVCKHYCSKQ